VSLLLLLLLAAAGTDGAATSDGADVKVATPGVAVLLVDTDRGMGTIDDDIYGLVLQQRSQGLLGMLQAGLHRAQRAPLTCPISSYVIPSMK
jgi:hypothetical protein